MSSISVISGTKYSLLYDKDAVGGGKLSRNSREGVGNIVDMADEARIIAQEIANLRAAESARPPGVSAMMKDGIGNRMTRTMRK